MESDQQFLELNKMLQDNQLNFNKSSPVDSAILPVQKFIVRNMHTIRNGIEYVLNNMLEVANIEYDFNDAQSTAITMKHLNWAKAFLDGNQIDTKEIMEVSNITDARSHISLGNFLLHCDVYIKYCHSTKKDTELLVHTDEKRLNLMKLMFDSTEDIPHAVKSTMDSVLDKTIYSCHQIIFDSSDFSSAIDALIMSISDRTHCEWSIKSVFIQENLKNQVIDALSEDRLNTIGFVKPIEFSKKMEEKNLNICKRFGGKMHSNQHNSITLFFEVLPEHISGFYSPDEIHPITINFFRTPQEAVQLIKNSADEISKIASIWTENIGLFYEVGTALSMVDSPLIWSNSFGDFDPVMPSLNHYYDAHKRNIDSVQRSVNVFLLLLRGNFVD